MADGFKRLWGAGFTRLVPVVPPGAEVSERGALHKRIAAGEDPRGKAPGILRADGKWSGLNFVAMESREEDLEEWGRWGASVGVKTGDGLIAVDIDTTDAPTAKRIYETTIKTLGPAKVRFGRKPKCLLLYEAPKHTPYQFVSFSTPSEDRAKVEILSDGRQFVADGIHPATGQPYAWPAGVPQRDELTRITTEQLDSLLNTLAQQLPEARRGASSATDAPDQQELKAPSWEALRRVVEGMPNTDALFPTRDDYIRVAYAIKAAAPDGHEQAACDLYLDWCDRWETDRDAHNDPDTALEDWNRAKGPFRVGYEWLCNHAPNLFFTEQEPDPIESMFAEADATRPEPTQRPPLRAEPVCLDELTDIPPREWLYGFKVSRGYVTFVASPGGVGKTAWVTAMALACAANKPLLHDKPIQTLRVWIMNLEDDKNEMRRRIKAALMHHDLDPGVLSNVRLNSGRDRRFTVVRADRNGQFIAEPDYHAVIEEMKREEIDILIVDPFLRSHRVPENDNEAQDEVMRLYAQIAHETRAGVVLVHHVKKGAQAGDMDGLRGGSTQGGGARSVLTLAPMSVEDAKHAGVEESQRRLHVRIDDAKNNMAPPASRAEWIKLESVALGNGTPMYPEGDRVQVAVEFALPGAWEGLDLAVSGGAEGDAGFPSDLPSPAEIEALRALDAGPGNGERYSTHARAGDRWAGALLMERFGRSRVQATEIVKTWERRGWVISEDYTSPGQRKSRLGARVIWTAVPGRLEAVAASDEPDCDVFG